MKKKQFTISIQPTHKQKIGWEKLRDNTTQFIMFGGGAGGGKSWLGCEWLLTMCIAYPGTKWFMARNELKRIKRSTYITFKKVCAFHNIPPTCWKTNHTDSYIEFWNGSRIDMLDISYAPSDPLYERFGSEEYTSGWIEEAGEVKFMAFDVLKSRIGRHMNKEYDIYPKMLLTCNPKKNWLYFEFYKPWRANELPEDTAFIQALYNDNPYTADTYGALLSKIKDKATKDRLKFGIWEYENDDANLMTYEKIINIFNIELKVRVDNEWFLTVDVARFGRNKAVFILWQGYFIRKIWYYEKSSTPFIEEKIKSICRQFHIERSHVIVDQDGVGGGVVDHLPGVYSFVNNSRAIEEFDDDPKYREQETIRFSYSNLRSQCYARLSEYVNDGIVGCYDTISPEVRNWIIEELEAIRKKDTDKEGTFQVISKDDIKEIIGRSPDFGDSMMMRFAYGLGSPRETVAEGEEFEIGMEW